MGLAQARRGIARGTWPCAIPRSSHIEERARIGDKSSVDGNDLSQDGGTETVPRSGTPLPAEAQPDRPNSYPSLLGRFLHGAAPSTLKLPQPLQQRVSSFARDATT
jgi:hypothetical protein